jgi:hypothetical protein
MRRTVPTLCACALLILAAPAAPARADDPRPYAGTFNLVLTQVIPQPDGDILIQGLLQDGQATILGPFHGDVQYLVHPDGSFEGTAEKVASNGDVLRESLAGSLTPLGSVGTFEVRAARAASRTPAERAPSSARGPAPLLPKSSSRGRSPTAPRARTAPRRSPSPFT